MTTRPTPTPWYFPMLVWWVCVGGTLLLMLASPPERPVDDEGKGVIVVSMVLMHMWSLLKIYES